MRGKLRLPQLTASSSGLIPAYAGKTIGQMPRSCQCWAHPRVCGENTLFAKINAQNCGSSPRMRGKLRSVRAPRPGRGLIPAYAGKTESLGSAEEAHRAHPRVCGENTPLARRGGVYLGSSPRMRGKPPLYETNSDRARLIPAYAGKTNSRKCTHARRPAHPRVCGENRALKSHLLGMWGSSPRMRGKPSARIGAASRGRLIPAYAGKTSSR